MTAPAEPAALPTGQPATRTRSRRLPWFTIVIIGGFFFVGLFAPWLTAHDAYTPSLSDRLAPPSAEYWLGTDSLGRDMLTRLFFGARASMIVVLTALGAGAAVGITLGLLAGYFRGWIDTVVSRSIDAVLGFPPIFFGLLLAVTVGASLRSVVIAISLVLWARFARVIRGEVISIREKDFIAQAKINGGSSVRIILVHVLPNVLNATMVLVSINMGYVITLESILSFLGAGIPPPIPSWGGMISEGQNYVSSAWWIAIVPGVAILLTVLALNLMGDWLRDRLDPKLRDRI